MKNQKLLLDDDEELDISVGLVRLVKNIPDYELFYHINHINNFHFSRISDVIKIGKYYDYYHTRFQTYHSKSKTYFQLIANKSSEFLQKKAIEELFVEEIEVNFLLPNYKDVDYIIKTSDTYSDFSVILLPKNLAFQIQEIELNSNEELYHLIHYYE